MIPQEAVKPLFRFKGRATGSDPTGYYYRNWDNAQNVSVLAETEAEATEKAWKLLGEHPRFGSWNRPGSGWAIIWDSIDEELTARAATERGQG